MRKRCFGFILVLSCLLLCGCSSVLDSVQFFSNGRRPDAPLAQLPYIDENIKTSFEPQVMDFYYQQLTDPAQQTLYRAYLQFLIDGTEDSVYIKGDFTKQQVSSAMYALQYDYPQFLTRCWRYECTYYSTSSGRGLGVEISPGEEDYDYAGARQELYQGLSEILQQAEGYADPWERELFLYDLLIERVTYDRTISTELQNNLTPSQQLPHTAYGALINGSAVCDGYTYLFQLLCSYAGIPTTTVVGVAQQGEQAATGESENHAWNLVKIGEEYYYCDPTWDDNGDQYLDSDGDFVISKEPAEGMRQVLPSVTHFYYNLSYAQIAQNHQFSKNFAYPDREGSPQDYYSRRGLTAASRGELERLILDGCQNLNEGDVGFELRLDYSVADPAEEIFNRMRLIGIRGTAVVSNPGGEGFGCLVFVYR